MILAFIRIPVFAGNTDADIKLLAQVIHVEAGSESMQGKIAVGNVVMNRVKGYASSVYAIVTAKNQFAYNSGISPNAASYEAATRVIKHGEQVIPASCYYFKSSGPPANGYPTWSGKKDDIRTYWGKIGGNYFYLRNPDGLSADAQRIKPPKYTYEYDTPRLGTKPSDTVINIQKLLAVCGYDIEPDGYFGDSTDVAVKDFQKKQGLKEDGIVDDKTMQALEAEAVTVKAEIQQKENDAYWEDILPGLKQVYKQKLVYDTIDDVIIDAISQFRMQLYLERLEKEHGFSKNNVRVKQENEFYFSNTK
jgi:hypothetical protein